jgi:hypothetical protein
MSSLLTILEHIKTRPGTFFGGGDRARSIHALHAFIIGFECGQRSSGESGDLDFFTEWTATHYHALAEGRGSFDMILEHEGGDEQKAFDEFFRVLPDFIRDRRELGRDGILSRFSDVQDQLLAAFRKHLENQ